MSNRRTYPEDLAEWQDHPESPEAKGPVLEIVELTNRERALMDLAFREGYEMGKHHGKHEIQFNVDGLSEDFIEIARVDGSLDDLPCV